MKGKASMDMDKMRSSAQKASDMMKLLGHPHRLMILCELNLGERSVSELSEKINIGQSPLSQHLARMRHEGVVSTRRNAQTVYYSLTEGAASQLIQVLYDIYCDS